MKRFLIILSLGPVQSLIGAARRTRDLWCGSWLLSEAARAAAHALHNEQKHCLIFPCLDNPDKDLKPQNNPGDAANIVNILRAEVTADDAEAARALCDKAKKAAISHLTELGEKAKNEMKGMKRPIRDEVWDAQINDILEVFTAWVPIAEGSNGYEEASKQLGVVLAARKATRDFRACELLSTKGLPKSSLDGALETVLQDLKDWPEGDKARRKLRLSSGEQLDALGVIKRLAGNSDQFTAYSRIAADAWIEQLTCEQQKYLREKYEPLVGLELATRVSGNKGIYDALPYDAQMLYEFRLDNELARTGADAESIKALKDLKNCIKQISQENKAGSPVPYAAILKADGDRMGVLVSRATKAEQSRKISLKLHEFASEVRQIVRWHRGHAIYAGGDDVLALVPLEQVLDCSQALAKSFKNALDEIAENMGICSAERPTLAVGLGIGHLMEPLGSLRARADRAEHTAKGDGLEIPRNALRNALAIELGIRSGAEISWRTQWNDKDALDALAQFTKAYRDGLLPTRVAYDLRGIDQRFAWLRDDNSETAHGMRSAEIDRMLERARIEGGDKRIPKELQALIQARAKKQSLKALADTLIIARWLSARTESDLGERT